MWIELKMKEHNLNKNLNIIIDRNKMLKVEYNNFYQVK